MNLRSIAPAALAAGLTLAPGAALASSHMDAPLITLDDAANTTDVYAFLSSRGGEKYLSTTLAVSNASGGTAKTHSHGSMMKTESA